MGSCLALIENSSCGLAGRSWNSGRNSIAGMPLLKSSCTTPEEVSRRVIYLSVSDVDWVMGVWDVFLTFVQPGEEGFQNRR